MWAAMNSLGLSSKLVWKSVMKTGLIARKRGRANSEVTTKISS